MQIIDDSLLVERTLKGNLSAYEALVKKYQQSIFNFCKQRLDDPEAASDATQEAFVRAFKHLKDFAQEKSFKTWLFTIAKNYCTDTLRKNTKLANLSETHPDDKESLWDRVFNSDRVESVKLALLRLPAAYRKPIKQYYWQDLSYENIARINGLPINTVKTRIRRARLMLKKILQDKESL